MTCESKIFQEKELLQISASVLSAEKFDETDFCQLVNQITVQPDGSLIFHLFSGENRVWQNRHISDFLHTATVTDCFQDKIFCEQCNLTCKMQKNGKLRKKPESSGNVKKMPGNRHFQAGNFRNYILLINLTCQKISPLWGAEKHFSREGISFLKFHLTSI